MTSSIIAASFAFLVLGSFAFAQTPKAQAIDQAPLPPPPVDTSAAPAFPPPQPADDASLHVADPSGLPGTESPSQMAKNLLSGIIEEYNYEGTGKRDPFQPYAAAPKQLVSVTEGPSFPLQKFDLDQLKLIGIIWEIRSPKAMILDPSGKGYIVRTNERLGKNNGYIAKIREGELVVVESFTGGDGKTSYQTKLVKLVQE